MADNLTTPVASGTIVAAKDIGGVQYPRNLIVDEAGVDAIGVVGANPSANTVLGRLKVAADALTQVVAALQGTLEISAESLPLAAGAATASKQDDIIAALGETLAISGEVGISGTVPVSATALPLPNGAATESGLAAIAAALAGDLNVTGEFYPASQPVSAASLPLPTGASTAAKQDEASALLDAVAVTEAPFTITPSASDALEREIKGIAISEAGTIVFRYPGEDSDRTVTLSAGLFPLRATHIRDTSTATGLTGF